MKNDFKILLCSAVAAVSLAGCSGSGFVADSQMPRPYIAAHDIIHGQCDHVNLNERTVTGKVATVHAVECPQENGGVEDAGGVQASDIK